MSTHEVLQFLFPVHRHFQQVGNGAVQCTVHTPRHLCTLPQRGVNLLVQLLDLFLGKRLLRSRSRGIRLLVFIELAGLPAPCRPHPLTRLALAPAATFLLLLLEQTVNLPRTHVVVLVVQCGMFPHLDEPISLAACSLVQTDVNGQVGRDVGELCVFVEQVLEVRHVHEHDVVVLMQDNEAARGVVQTLHELAAIDDAAAVGRSGGEVVDDFPVTDHQNARDSREAGVTHHRNTLLGNDLLNGQLVHDDSFVRFELQ